MKKFPSVSERDNYLINKANSLIALLITTCFNLLAQSPCSVSITANPAYSVCAGQQVTLTASNANAPGNSVKLVSASNQYFITPNLNSQLNSGSITVELWFKATAAGVVMTELGQSTINTGWHDSQIEVLSNGDVSVRVWALTPVVVGNISFNTWNHVAVRYNALTSTIDGVLNGVPSSYVNTGTKQWPSTGTFYYAFGAQESTNLGSGAWFDGQIDEIRIWKMALSNAQIAANYSTAVAANSNNLVAYYKCDQATGTSLNDATSNSFNATLMSGATFTTSGATVNTGENFNSYSWSTGSTSSSIVVTPTTNTQYSVSITSTTGCSSTSSAITIYTINPSLAVTSTSNQFCTGPTVTLTASGLAGTTTVSTFTTVGNNYWVAPTSVYTVEVLVVAGGGSGGFDAGGGGGGGGVVYASIYSVTPGTAYSFSVGVGGASISTYAYNGLPGSNSTFGTLTAIGGDGGYDNHAQQQVGTGNGRTGGCGGGQGAAHAAISGPGFGTSGQGYNGGTSTVNCCGGGGGGAGAVGGNATNSLPGAGGIGFLSSITGTPLYYGGGGGGGTWSGFTGGTGGSGGGGAGGSTTLTTTGSNTIVNGIDGTNGLGGGGGGMGYAFVSGGHSGSGGSGVVILRYAPILVSNASYTWSNGSTGPSIAITPTNTTNFTVNYSSPAGCSNGGTFTLNVYPKPVLSITGSNTLCAGKSSSLAASGALTYTWTNATSNSSLISISPTVTTSYSVTGTSSFGCVSNATSIAVTVYSVPTVAINGNTSVCSSATLQLSASGASTYTWTNNLASSSIVVTPTVNTVYTVSGTNSLGCSGNTASLSVTVYSLPIISVVGTNTVCSGSSVQFTASGASSYTWNSTVTGSTFSATPAASSTYIVKGTNTLGCISNSVSQAVTVYSLPVLSISGSNTLCNGSTTQFTASGASSYSWNTGALTNTIVISPSTNTNYTLNGTSAQGCTATPVVQTVNVYTLPVIAVSGANSLCLGETVQLNASGASSYTWTGNLSGSTFTLSPTSNSTYTVTGTSSQGCVGNTATMAVTVYSLPVIVISGTTAVCQGNSITLSGSGAATYTWSNGANSTSVLISPTSNTTYSLSGKSASGCAGNTATIAIASYSNPVIAISGNTAICAGTSSSLQATGASTYSWSTASTVNSIVATPSTSTSYSVVGTSSLGCISNAAVTVSVQSAITVAVNGVTALCVGDTATLTATGASNYTWSGASTSTAIVVSPLTTTVYSLTGTNSLCTAQTQHTLLVNPLPVLSVSGSTLVCSAQSVTHTVSGATNYSWSNGNASATMVASPTANTVYTVTGTDSNGCQSSALDSVNVVNYPVLILSGDTAFCSGESTTLSVSGANNYTWSNGTNGNTVVLTPTISSSFSVIGGVSPGCNDTAAIQLNVKALPAISISPLNSTICLGEQIKISGSGAYKYNWSTGDTTAQVQVAPLSSTVYTLTGSSEFGCDSAITSEVIVNACEALPEDQQTVVKVYPNPSNGIVSVLNNSGGRMQVEIHNSTGQLLMSKEMDASGEIDLSNFAKGVYHLSVFNNSQRLLHTKLILEN